MDMKQKLNIENKIAKLAFGKSNDAVKLVFLDPENTELLDNLDLSMVAEVKRGSGGAVEVKLINRIALLELLLKLPDANAKHDNPAESFFIAMDKAAKNFGETNNEV